MRATHFVLVLLVGCGSERGPQGLQGAPGAGLVSTLTCAAAKNNLGYEYEVATFEDGSVFVSCGMTLWQSTSGFSSFWKAGSSNATSGVCQVFFAIAPDTIGTVTFTRSPQQAVYASPGSKQDGATETFASTDCRNN